VHRKQASGLLNGELPIRSRFHMKMRNAGVFFVKEVKLSGTTCARNIQVRLFSTPSDYFHMHPSVCSLESEPRLLIWFDCLWRGLVPLHGASAEQGAKVWG
jgi:hypothetical protein